MGIVFQDRRLFPHLSAVDNVAFPLVARGMRGRPARAAAAALLARLGLADRAGARPAALSGGEAQRVALARALAGEPRMLLLDEPLTALDARSRGEVRAWVRAALAGFEGVCVLITHDAVDALSLAGRLVVLEAGRVTQVGTPHAVRRAPRTPYAAALVGHNLYLGRLVWVGRGAGRLVTADGDITVGWPEGLGEGVGFDAAGVPALGRVRPEDVALHREPPEGSARNVLAGVIESIVVEGDRARVRVASRPPVTAVVTLGSVERLGLVEGLPVWASFKAVEVDVEVEVEGAGDGEREGEGEGEERMGGA